MGNNESKPTKPDSECAERENQHNIPPLNRSSSKRRKTSDIVSFTGESKSDLSVAKNENHNSMDFVRNHTDTSAVIKNNACTRDRNHLDNLLPDQTADKSDKEQSEVRRKSKKHYSKANEDKTQTETTKVLSVDEKQNDQLIASKMNGIVKPVASNIDMHQPMAAFSAIQAPDAKCSKHRSHSDKREDGNSAWTPIAGAFCEDATTNMNRHIGNSNSLEAAASSRLAKSTKSDFESRNNPQTKSSSELPEPSFMKQVSTVGSVLAPSNSSPSVSFSTTSAVQSSPRTSHSLLFSNAGAVASSNSNLFVSSILTQPTATSSSFGNISYSGNVLSSVTASSILPSMTNSTSVLPNGISYGNFSMRSGASATGRSSPSVTPSNSYLQTFRHSFSSYTSQTNVSVGSNSNSSSSLTTNISAPRSADTTSHTSIAFDANVSGSLSNMGNHNLRNSPDEIVRNREENETEVEEDNMDLLYADGFAFQTDNSSHDYSRNMNNSNRDKIFIRTSVGDTITQISAKNITLNTTYVDNDLTDENMGIILERPKYPRYATLASRERSFQNVWPATNKMSWVKLPEAGFVYTGTADCVRCYYCNGGLREWLKDDCPWTEHARYYPHCPHVRQNKGDEFVRRVRGGADEGAVDQDGGAGDEMDVDNRADNSSLLRDQEAIKIAGEIISDRPLLEKAAYYIKNVQEKSSFDAQQLAAIAFEIEDGTIKFNFEDAFEDDRSSIADEVLTESDSSDSENDIEVDGCELEEENRMLRDRSLCKVCLDATACVLFLECGHMIACAMCAPALKTCAVCRAEVKGTVRAIYATDR